MARCCSLAAIAALTSFGPIVIAAPGFPLESLDWGALVLGHNFIEERLTYRYRTDVICLLLPQKQA